MIKKKKYVKKYPGHVFEDLGVHATASVGMSDQQLMSQLCFPVLRTCTFAFVTYEL